MSCSASFCFFIISVCSSKSEGQAVHAPTTELENRLHLDSFDNRQHHRQQCSSLSDHLTMLDNMSAASNDCRPRVVPQSIKWLSTTTRDRSLQIHSLVEFLISMGHFVPPPPIYAMPDGLVTTTTTICLLLLQKFSFLGSLQT